MKRRPSIRIHNKLYSCVNNKHFMKYWHYENTPVANIDREVIRNYHKKSHILWLGGGLGWRNNFLKPFRWEAQP